MTLLTTQRDILGCSRADVAVILALAARYCAAFVNSGKEMQSVAELGHTIALFMFFAHIHTQDVASKRGGWEVWGEV